MNIKITDSKTVSSVSKKKKAGQTGNATGASFRALVDGLNEAATVESTDAVFEIRGGEAGLEAYDPYNVPQDAKGRGAYMLERLEDLERDILSGAPTDAIARLRHALETQAIDKENLSPRLQEVLDEIEMRASVEIAKMDVANKK